MRVKMNENRYIMWKWMESREKNSAKPKSFMVALEISVINDWNIHTATANEVVFHSIQCISAVPTVYFISSLQ